MALTKEQKILNKLNKLYELDYVNHDLKLCIEFNGVYWHMKPSLYEPNDINNTLCLTASTIWSKDAIKKDVFLSKYPDYKYIYVWEDEAYINYKNDSKTELNEQYMFDLIAELGLTVALNES